MTSCTKHVCHCQPPQKPETALKIGSVHCTICHEKTHTECCTQIPPMLFLTFTSKMSTPLSQVRCLSTSRISLTRAVYQSKGKKQEEEDCSLLVWLSSLIEGSDRGQHLALQQLPWGTEVHTLRGPVMKSNTDTHWCWEPTQAHFHSYKFELFNSDAVQVLRALMCFGTMLFLECWPLEDPIRSRSGCLLRSLSHSLSQNLPWSLKAASLDRVPIN